MIEVVCAILRDAGDRVFAARRSEIMPLPLKWEFPGGKVEPGESADAALVREIAEELGLHIRIKGSLTPVVHTYPGFTIRLIPMACEAIGGEVVLREHIDFQWIPVNELGLKDWAAADIPVVQELMRLAKIERPSER